jgi:hypothetical protein
MIERSEIDGAGGIMKKFNTIGMALAAVITAGAWSNVASADTWKTTQADGTVVETPLKAPDEPAQDYKSGSINPSTRVNRSGSTMRVPGAKGLPAPGGPRNKNDKTGTVSSNIYLGTIYPGYGYPGYGYPGGYYYPSAPYGYSGPIGNPYTTNNPPWVTVVPVPGQGYAPYGYPPYSYPYPGYPPAYPPYGYPYPGGYGYGSVPANGSYYGYSQSNRAGISIGSGGARVSIGSSRTTTGGSTTTNIWP